MQTSRTEPSEFSICFLELCWPITYHFKCHNSLLEWDPRKEAVKPEEGMTRSFLPAVEQETKPQFPF